MLRRSVAMEFIRPLREIRKGRANQALRRRLEDTFHEREQVGVNRVGLGCGHAVREAVVDFQGAIPQQLCRQRSSIGIRHNLVVIAMQHEDGHRDPFQVFGEVRLRERDDAVIVRLGAANAPWKFWYAARFILEIRSLPRPQNNP